MDEQLTDHQLAEIAKKWIKENGSFVLGGLVLGLGALFGWNQWQDYQDAQAEFARDLALEEEAEGDTSLMSD